MPKGEMVIRCKDCKWWRAVGDEGGSFCLSDPDPHACLNPLLGEEAEHENRGRNDLLVYPYGEGAHLFPGPEFGCVHGEKA